MRALALDVGARRIGFAISDPGGSFALPLEVRERTNVRDDVAAIVEIAEREMAQVIVVGDPVALDGSRGVAAENMDRFVTHLARVWTGPIERVDERLTTAAANKALIGADVSRANRKRVVDKVAAALILETYLARQRR